MNHLSHVADSENEQSTVKIRCSADSEPVSTFSWYKVGQNETLLRGNGTSNYNGLDLVIENPTKSDDGTYICEADNGIGEKDRKTLELIFAGKY